MENLFADCERKMKNSLDHLRQELSKLRTGSASGAILEGIKIDYYGNPTPLNQVATLGVPDGKLSDSPTHKIVAAQLAVDGRSAKPKYKEFKDNVATVDTRKFYGGSSANGHYGGNGEFIMQVGDEMGKAMVELLKKQKGEKEEKKEKK